MRELSSRAIKCRQKVWRRRTLVNYSSVLRRNCFICYRTIKDMDGEQTTAGSRWFQTNKRWTTLHLVLSPLMVELSLEIKLEYLKKIFMKKLSIMLSICDGLRHQRGTEAEF